ncbi:Satratoxin biosynthesis SC1 cluster protein 4 [Colletotrichum fructicola]|uniref:Integral membrane protein n=2 Tax=Colletotrichum fructicola (strain Nara gc5) TaxID=1213859 RepID=L2GCE8_COLFN|nr:Satratoxin biosynthesis SC1 cluster protein 4 [Colletotrichum fructicola]
MDESPHGHQLARSTPMPAFNMTQRACIGFNASFIIFIVFVIGIRLYSRYGITKSGGPDDIVMVAGTIATIIMSICIIISVSNGLGLIIADIPPESWKPMLLSFWISRVFYALALMLVKIALLLFYLRLDHRPRMRWIVFGLMAVVIATGIAHAGISIFECSPPAIFWTFGGNFRIFGEHCMTAATQQKFWDATGAIVVVTDLCLWLCPLPMVWSLQLPIRQKIAVSAVFALGIVSVAAACTRFYYVRKLASTKEIYQQFAESLIWYSLEIYLAIFCGCTSAFKVFLRKHFPSLLGSLASKTRYVLGSSGKNGNVRMTASSFPMQNLSGRHTGRRTTITAVDTREGSEARNEVPPTNDSEEAIVPKASTTDWDTRKE